MARNQPLASADPVPAEAGQLLERLAERVRQLRSGRGMSRKALARHADVSERYLAELEAGRGNVSILLLWRIAQALGVPLGDLVDAGPERPAEATAIDHLLQRLSPAEVREARDLLTERFGTASPAQRASRIALIGLRGGGK